MRPGSHSREKQSKVPASVIRHLTALRPTQPLSPFGVQVGPLVFSLGVWCVIMASTMHPVSLVFPTQGHWQPGGALRGVATHVRVPLGAHVRNKRLLSPAQLLTRPRRQDAQAKLSAVLSSARGGSAGEWWPSPEPEQPQPPGKLCTSRAVCFAIKEGEKNTGQSSPSSFREREAVRSQLPKPMTVHGGGAHAPQPVHTATPAHLCPIPEHLA